MKDQEKNVLRMPEELIIDMNEHLPGDLTIEDIKKLCQGKPFRVSFICDNALMNTDIADMLDLSFRSSNALRRAGYRTVGDLIETEDLFENLGRIRNCGAKSRAEIMGRLFFYQYSLIPKEKRTIYLYRILELNGIKQGKVS